MHVAKRIFLAASIGSENFSLPYSLLLDYSTFEFTTLPYPTLPEIEKPLPVRACSSGVYLPFANLPINSARTTYLEDGREGKFSKAENIQNKKYK